VIVEQVLVARANAVQPSSPPAAPWAPKKRALAGRGRTAPDTTMSYKAAVALEGGDL